MSEEAVKVDPDVMGHKNFHEKASTYGAAFEGSTFEPGLQKTASERDYTSARVDAQEDVFSGNGYDEDKAAALDEKFETYMGDRKEMEAQAGEIGKGPPMNDDMDSTKEDK